MNRLQMTLVTGAATAVIATLGLWAYNPNAGLLQSLQTVDARSSKSANASSGLRSSDNVSSLIHQPIFVMTTGAAAYKEKTFQLFGVSITPNRKAVLLSVDGGESHWLKLGEVEGDSTLIDIGTNGASFDTPTGIKTVGLNDPISAGQTITQAGHSK